MTHFHDPFPGHYNPTARPAPPPTAAHSPSGITCRRKALRISSEATTTFVIGIGQRRHLTLNAVFQEQKCAYWPQESATRRSCISPLGCKGHRKVNKPNVQRPPPEGHREHHSEFGEMSPEKKRRPGCNPRPSDLIGGEEFFSLCCAMNPTGMRFFLLLCGPPPPTIGQ